MAARKLPSTMRQILVNTRSTDFRKATAITEVPMPKPRANEVLVKNMFVGINASDVNFSAGRYDPSKVPPFPCGFEGIGKVVDKGEDSKFDNGQTVVYINSGSFADYTIVPSKLVVPVPTMDPNFMSIILSGLTASISLEKEGDLKEGKTVLVTAAAGGTGQFAVQIAKLAGCHVIGTCSSPEKVEFLKSIGCDRPVNYKTEDLQTVLSKEYPKGMDVVYESIGKDIFDTAMRNMAVNGRMIVIGMISGYHDDRKVNSGALSNIPWACLQKSASVRGFFLMHYPQEFRKHIPKLVQLYMQKKLKVTSDNGPKGRPFHGLGDVAEAIDYMYEGKNVGKIIVNLQGPKSSL